MKRAMASLRPCGNAAWADSGPMARPWAGERRIYGTYMALAMRPMRACVRAWMIFTAPPAIGHILFEQHTCYKPAK
jgi:hypothetical protein